MEFQDASQRIGATAAAGPILTAGQMKYGIFLEQDRALHALAQ